MKYPITIVCTCYNQGQFAERAIKSISAQKYLGEIELIVVDDGSTDNSLDLIQIALLKHQHIEQLQVISKENGGTASARNAGVKKAQHDIIGFLDIDDQYHPEKITRSVYSLVQYKHVGAVYSDYIEVKEDGKKHRVFKPPYSFNLLLKYCIVSTNSIVHRKVFDKIGYFDESIKKLEDYDLWLRIGSQFMLRHIPDALFTYYNHGGNKTANANMNEWNSEKKFIKDRIMKGQYFVDSQTT